MVVDVARMQDGIHRTDRLSHAFGNLFYSTQHENKHVNG